MANVETHTFGITSIHEIGGLFVFGNLPAVSAIEQARKDEKEIEASELALRGAMEVIHSLDADSQTDVV